MRRKPAVFISSTINDFEDLRSSLRFWLEESGFEVWLSEYNDMEKSPGANTFEACFDSIRRADFYVLLIGDRRGSLYNAESGVSVTQQEYRVAYAAFQEQGRPVPVFFIRSEVKNQLDSWNKSGKPKRHPFEDAPFVAEFIAEVTRETETAKAVRGIGALPLANWLHSFRDLRDIVDALKVALSLRTDVSLQRVLMSIQLELEKTLATLLGKYQHKATEDGDIAGVAARAGLSFEVAKTLLAVVEIDMPFPLHWYFASVAKELPLHYESQSQVQLNGQQAVRLSLYLFGGIVAPVALRFPSLTEALVGGLLLAYNPPTRSFEETELSLAARDLLIEADVHAGRFQIVQPFLNHLLTRLSEANKTNQREFRLPWEEAVFIWCLYYSQVNLYRRVASLYAYLKNPNNKRSPDPDPDALMPSTPLGADMEQAIKRERPSIQDIRKWSEIDGFWNL